MKGNKPNCNDPNEINLDNLSNVNREGAKSENPHKKDKNRIHMLSYNTRKSGLPLRTVGKK
jgi:hypothetical protein